MNLISILMECGDADADTIRRCINLYAQSATKGTAEAAQAARVALRTAEAMCESLTVDQARFVGQLADQCQADYIARINGIVA